MATIAPSATTRWNWRTIAFTTLVALFGLQAFIVGIFFIARSPWADPATLPDGITPWHSAQAAMLVGLLSGTLLLIGVWRPQQKPVLFQLFGVFMLQAILIALLRIQPLGFDPVGWVNLALTVLMLVLYPRFRDLFSLKGDGRLSRPLLALAVVISMLLLWDAARNLQWQWAGIGGESARRYFWLQTALANLALAIAGGLTAIKRPGWQVLGVLLGLGYLYLGIVALTIAPETGSWGAVGGAVSALVGIGYCAVTLWEARRARPVVSSVVTTPTVG